jgi:outer membrane immunogenic protein
MKTNGLRGFVLAAIAGLGAAGSAAVAPVDAADMAIKAPTPQAPYNWSGCYFGGTIGWGAANDWHTTDLGNPGLGLYAPGAVNPWDFSLNSQVLAGGTVGCNVQPFSAPLVFGVEGEGGWLHITGPGTQMPGIGAANVSDAVALGQGYAMIAGRVGWAFYERILLYGKVGVQFYDEKSAISGVNGAIASILATGSKTQDPLAVGGGVEYAFDSHWTGKAEYMLIDKGSSYLACGSGFCWKEDPSTVYTFKIGLNYKLF